MDRSVEINRKDLHTLRQMYAKKNYMTYTTIDNYIQWFEQNPNLKHIRFVCLNGDFSDGTFIVTDRCYAMADTLNENSDNLLRLTKLMDLRKGYIFLCIRAVIQPTIIAALQYRNCEVVEDSTLLLYYCPKEVALNYDIQVPLGIELRPITKFADIEKINVTWSRYEANSLLFVQRMIEYNINIGAFTEDGTMISWILRHPTGLLSTLETDKNYLGHGYATLVTKYLSKKIAEMDYDLYAVIYESNQPSRNLFSKLRFKQIEKCHWIATNVTWTPDDD